MCIRDRSKTGTTFRILGKYYLDSKRGADTWYTGVYAGYRSVNNVPDISNRFNRAVFQSTFTAGIHGGYKFVLKPKIIFDLGLGLGRSFTTAEGSNVPSLLILLNSLGIDGFVRAEIGYRF